MKKAFFTIWFLSGAACVFGGGFQLNLQGIQQLAMGGGGAAYPWDVSTIFYNPGGLSRLEGIQAYGSMLGIAPSIKYVETPTGGYSYETRSQWFTPFNVYVGGTIKKGSKIGLGLGVYTPFGSGTKWPDDWAGRYLSQETALQSIFFQPTVSYRINDLISLGAGFVYAYGSLKLRQAIPVQFMDGRDGAASLKGNGSGIGFNAGIQIKATDKLNVGVTYRSKVRMNVKSGTADFDVPASLTTSFPDTKFSAALPLPEVFSLGLSYQITGDLVVQADLNYVGWKAYDTLSFDYKDNTAQLEDTHTPRLYQNKAAFRLGAHYLFSEKLAGMIGGAYDPSPVRDHYVSPELPDANRLTGSLGLTYSPVSRLKIMLAVEFVSSVKRDATFEPGNFSGKYQSKAFNGGLGIGYQF
jgi:long-chain fatty acid transport protein